MVHGFDRLKPATLLMVGDKDMTAIGKQFGSPELRAQLGHYPELAKDAARSVPHAVLVEFPAFGHAPQLQDPEMFKKALLDGLGYLKR